MKRLAALICLLALAGMAYSESGTFGNAFQWTPSSGTTRTWVKKYSAERVGPGNNLWKPDNVYFDSSNNLHLKFAKASDGLWYSAEVKLNEVINSNQQLLVAIVFSA